MYKALKIGLGVSAAGVGALASAFVFRVPLIVATGIAVADGLKLGAWALLGSGAALSLGGCVPIGRHLLNNAADKRLAGSLKESDNTPVIRAKLTRLAASMPTVQQLLERCLSQLDEMDRRKLQLAEILRLTGAGESWGDVTALLDSIERTILQNMKVVILHGLNQDENDVDTDTYSRLIEDQLSKTRTLLDKVKETTTYVTDLIGGSTGSDENAELESYLNVLRDMVDRSS